MVVTLIYWVKAMPLVSVLVVTLIYWVKTMLSVSVLVVTLIYWVKAMAWVCVGSDFNDSVSDSADFYLTFQITNATTLQKTVEHLGKLQQDRQQLQEEARRLREEVEELNGSIR